MALTKAELADVLVEKVPSISRLDAKTIVELFFEEIGVSLENGEEVKITGFGSFILHDKPARPGRNPKTGEQVMISPRRVVAFRPSQKLKDIINQ
ncbi:MAG: integration host factor subunit alpha [Neisseriaceae bacterium]|nr:integration host factor subunit alpha [Neisseriaceae bacterium]